MNQMCEHFGLTEEVYNGLLKSGVTQKDFLKSIPLFDPDSTGAPIAQVSLYHYVDRKGNYDDPPAAPHKKIAKAIFDRLKIKEKIAISEYMDDLDDGEF